MIQCRDYIPACCILEQELPDYQNYSKLLIINTQVLDLGMVEFLQIIDSVHEK